MTNKAKEYDKTRNWDNLVTPEAMPTDELMKLIPDNLDPPLPPIVFDPKKITLKNFKFMASLSEETLAYTADIWWNNKKVAYSSNRGHGGCDEVREYPDHPGALKEIDKWVATLPPESCYGPVYHDVALIDKSHAQEDMKMTLAGDDAWRYRTNNLTTEDVITKIVAHLAWKKDVSKKIGQTAVIRPKAELYPGVYTWKKKLSPADLAALKQKEGWIVPFADFIKSPPHYYPAPHEFGICGYHEAVIKHVPSGRLGVARLGTTDYEVELEVFAKLKSVDAVLKLLRKRESERTVGSRKLKCVPTDLEMVQPAKVGYA